MNLRLTHIGTATVLLEIGALRLLTDPALDASGGKYSFGFGTGSQKLEDPALPPEGLGRIDAVLLSHDHHADNLDTLGRALLPSVGKVLTTASGAKRLGGNAIGLNPWATHELTGADGLRVKITATPARHGPPLSGPLVGDVIGFILEWSGQAYGPIYISGDTVWFEGVAEVGQRFKLGTALLHVGGVKFGLTGPIRYTMDGPEAARAATALGAKTVIPIHYEGWSHFRESRVATEKAFTAAGISERVKWLERGLPTLLEV